MRILYSDGSQGANNLNAGGWAYLEVINGNIAMERYGTDYSVDVTNNQMELRGAIEAAKMVQAGESAIIHCDSEYVIKGISDWIVGWQKNNWKTAKKEPVKNKEFWLELLEATKGKNIKWTWVRGHSNDEYNNRVDDLSKKCYASPQSIKSLINTSEIKKEITKLEPGSIFYLEDPSKRYITIIRDINVNGERGFLAKLFANCYGNELEFFKYSADIHIIDEKTEKESRVVYKAIEQLKDNIKNNFHKLKNDCKHKIINKSERAVCSICEESFGWYCYASKDHCCYYFSESGMIDLNNGEKISVPPGHNENYETYDACIFCGEPQERN